MTVLIFESCFLIYNDKALTTMLTLVRYEKAQSKVMIHGIR